jgi:hypothetical protein
MTYDQKLSEHTTTTTLLQIDFVNSYSHTVTYHSRLPPHMFPWKQ